MSPLHTDVSGVAPAIVVSGYYDTILDHSEVYVKALRAKDVPVRYRVYCPAAGGRTRALARSHARTGSLTAYGSSLAPRKDVNHAFFGGTISGADGVNALHDVADTLREVFWPSA